MFLPRNGMMQYEILSIMRRIGASLISTATALNRAYRYWIKNDKESINSLPWDPKLILHATLSGWSRILPKVNLSENKKIWSSARLFSVFACRCSVNCPQRSLPLQHLHPEITAFPLLLPRFLNHVVEETHFRSYWHPLPSPFLLLNRPKLNIQTTHAGRR